MGEKLGEVFVIPGVGAEGRGRPQKVVCYRDGVENGGLHLEEWRKRRQPAVSLPALLARVDCAFFIGNYDAYQFSDFNF